MKFEVVDSNVLSYSVRHRFHWVRKLISSNISDDVKLIDTLLCGNIHESIGWSVTLKQQADFMDWVNKCTEQQIYGGGRMTKCATFRLTDGNLGTVGAHSSIKFYGCDFFLRTVYFYSIYFMMALQSAAFPFLTFLFLVFLSCDSLRSFPCSLKLF